MIHQQGGHRLAGGCSRLPAGWAPAALGQTLADPVPFKALNLRHVTHAKPRPLHLCKLLLGPLQGAINFGLLRGDPRVPLPPELEEKLQVGSAVNGLFFLLQQPARCMRCVQAVPLVAHTLPTTPDLCAVAV